MMTILFFSCRRLQFAEVPSEQGKRPTIRAMKPYTQNEQGNRSKVFVKAKPESGRCVVFCFSDCELRRREG
jgi:hypothetical protein